jgi:hypothetical protein
MEHRFERWRRRHPEHRVELERAFDQARRLESALCELVDVRPSEVVRLRWVEPALERAEANGRLAAPGHQAAVGRPS